MWAVRRIFSQPDSPWPSDLTSPVSPGCVLSCATFTPTVLCAKRPCWSSSQLPLSYTGWRRFSSSVDQASLSRDVHGAGEAAASSFLPSSSSSMPQWIDALAHVQALCCMRRCLHRSRGYPLPMGLLCGEKGQHRSGDIVNLLSQVIVTYLPCGHPDVPHGIPPTRSCGRSKPSQSTCGGSVLEHPRT